MIIEDNCLDCHDGASAEGGLDLTALDRNLDDRALRDRWIQRKPRGQEATGTEHFFGWFEVNCGLGPNHTDGQCPSRANAIAVPNRALLTSNQVLCPRALSPGSLSSVLRMVSHEVTTCKSHGRESVVWENKANRSRNATTGNLQFLSGPKAQLFT
ncbi:c-type cytochrome domain-containing protein [Novipirellula galeiformis]|uniref:c-type cytochrome domain-containing protein n=1 Tax=Novipirellula galeiformis TaxID=2528004 RepID=UPI0036F3C9E5